MQDYSRRYSSVVGRRQSVSGRFGQGRPDAEGSWTIVGGVMLACAMVGLLATWGTANLADGVKADLVREQEEQGKLVRQREAMVAQHGGYMTAEWVEAEAAVKLGLFPPSAKQIGRP